MAQVKTSPSIVTVRNSRTGQLVTIKGAGALKDSELSMKRGLDLTKPIAEQALRGARKPKAK
ncbi:hypothetical protein [Pararhizobium sp. O133]|uniref:hypothetical protein n=1 Tax=Pararhizobium sp. O133 TaxID=3449278 RepID=UPI003F684C1E